MNLEGGVFLIKVRKKGAKRFRFLTPRGGETTLRIHASQFTDKAKAQVVASEIETLNPGVEAKVSE